MAFYISSILFGIFLTLVIYGCVWNNENYKYGGIIGAIFVAACGFGLMTSASCDHNKTNIIEDFDYAKTLDHVIIELPDGYVETFGDAATYNNIDKVKKVFDNKEFNFYGFEIKRYISLK